MLNKSQTYSNPKPVVDYFTQCQNGEVKKIDFFTQGQNGEVKKINFFTQILFRLEYTTVVISQVYSKNFFISHTHTQTKKFQSD